MPAKRKAAAAPGNIDPVPVGPAALCFKSELNLLQKPPIAQNCIRAAEYIQVDPVTALRSDTKVIDFLLPNSADAVWDLANCRFRADFKITDRYDHDVKGCRKPKSKSKIPASKEASASKKKTFDETEERDETGETEEQSTEDKSHLYDPVAASNNTLGSMFEKVEAAVNDCVINSSDTNHHLKSFVMNSINYTSDARSSILAPSGYHADVGQPASTTFTENWGMHQRAKYTQNGQVWSLYGKLSHDLFSIPTVLPVGTKLAFRLHRTRDEIFLCVDPTDPKHLLKGYRAQLLKIQCECLRLRLTPETINVLESQLANQAASYYFSRIESRTFFVPPNSMTHTAQNIFTGLCPSRIFFGFMSTRSYQGTYDRNTFSFEPHKLSYLCLRVDNRVFNRILQPDWTSESGALDTYIEYLKANRALNRPAEIEPDFSHYKTGPLTLYGFDLADDLSEASPSRRIGNLSLEARFSPKCSDEGLVCYVLATFTSSMFIDKFGGVTLEQEMRNG